VKLLMHKGSLVGVGSCRCQNVGYMLSELEVLNFYVLEYVCRGCEVPPPMLSLTCSDTLAEGGKLRHRIVGEIFRSKVRVAVAEMRENFDRM
jgi:hypothetical protein